MPIVIYGIDGANNKVETLTKEQILDAIAQAQQEMPILDYDSAFVSQIKEINHGDALKFWIGTQAEYNAITPKAANVLYIISDDNSKEEIIAAIDALSSSISGISTALQNKQDVLTFDTAPTQNSANPVTSGGVYNSIAKKSVLWEWDGQSQTMKHRLNDTIPLAKGISGFDYLGFVMREDDVHVFDTKRGQTVLSSFDVDTSRIVHYDGAEYIRRYSSHMRVSVSGTTATITEANYSRTDYYSNISYTDFSVDTSEDYFRKIIGFSIS